jgi:hypothetical protein
MSYDVKYIGMDVHKEAIVMAVQNESGKLCFRQLDLAPFDRLIWSHHPAG